MGTGREGAASKVGQGGQVLRGGQALWNRTHLSREWDVVAVGNEREGELWSLFGI